MAILNKGIKTRFRQKVTWGALAAVGIISISFGFSSVRVLKITGPSMTPEINDGDSILILNRTGRLSRGGVVVIHSPSSASQLLVRRVIALPGDVIEIRKGKLLINDTYVEEAYVSAQQNQRQRGMAPLHVPDDSYFVMADNRDGSFDSRDWGVVPTEQIYGKVLMRY